MFRDRVLEASPVVMLHCLLLLLAWFLPFKRVLHLLHCLFCRSLHQCIICWGVQLLGLPVVALLMLTFLVDHLSGAIPFLWFGRFFRFISHQLFEGVI